MRTIKTLENLRGKKYDYIIVGAGLSGAVHAHELSMLNTKKILMVEKRDHIAGNIYTEKKDGIDIHKYGSHIFHTNNDDVWNFVRQFTKFNDYKHRVVANTGQEHVMLPFSMVTFMQIFNVSTVEDVQNIIASEVDAHFHCDIPTEAANFEEQAIMLVGTTIYEKLIKHYTEKQWGRKCTELPAEIIKRLPKRWNTDTTYFNNAKYQGIPVNGYTDMVDSMLESNNIDYIQSDFIENIDEIIVCLCKTSSKLIYTGALDELFDYSLGHLEYRSLSFQDKHFNQKNYQGTAVVNFTGPEEDYTRITEHKHYSTDPEVLNLPTTHFTIERSHEHIPGSTIPYYPINDKLNNEKHQQYVELFKQKYPYGILSGRLANYKYYDMDKTIEEALKSVYAIIDFQNFQIINSMIK